MPKAVRFASGRISGRPPKHAAQNLLAGLATCAVCGGGLVIETSARTGRRASEYVCYRRRTNGTCENDLRVPVEDVNDAVLRSIEEHALTPEAIESVIALSERDDLAERYAALTTERTDIEKRIARLVAAVESGGDVAALVAKLRDLERRRQEIDQELTTLRPIPRLPSRLITDRLAEWRRLLRSSTTQARSVLQRVIRGRIVFTPEGRGYTFEAPTRFDKLFSGLVVPASVWQHAPGRGTERITRADVEENPYQDADFGALLDRVYAKGVASQAVPSWNQILSFLQQMAKVRESAGSAA